MASSGSHHHKHDHEHHVHIVLPQQEDIELHESKIIIEQLPNDILNVRLGFLQVKRTYEIHFAIEDNLGDVTYDPSENPYVKIMSAKLSDMGKIHQIVLIFDAWKEKVMEESVTLISKDNPSKKLTLDLTASVLGKGKGTPSLKEGIRCIKVDHSDDTEDSN